MTAGSVHWAIVPFRLQMNVITPDPPGYEPIGHDYLRQMFTGEGAGRGNLVDYFLDVSHGHLDISGSKVFPWLDLPTDAFTLGSQFYGWSGQYWRDAQTLVESGLSETEAELIAATRANTGLRQRVKDLAHDEIRKSGLDLSPYVGPLFVVKSPLGDFLVIADNSPRDDRLFGLDLSGAASEMGHGMDLEDSTREDSSAERTDYWDLMSVYSPRLGLPGYFDRTETAYFAEGGVRPPATPPLPFTRQGPGLNAANMQVAGWLDSSRVVTVSGAESVVLRPLHRRDLAGNLAARVGSYLVEFRMNEMWDVGIPRPCVLIHRVGGLAATGRARSELVIGQKNPLAYRAELLQGDVFEQGDPLDLFSTHLQIRVEEIDPAARVARLSVLVRPGRPPMGSMTYGGVDVGGGGLVWTPGRGFKRVPPDSPLRDVIETVASIVALEEALAGESDEGRLRLQQEAGDQVERLRNAVDHAARALGRGINA